MALIFSTNNLKMQGEGFWIKKVSFMKSSLEEFPSTKQYDLVWESTVFIHIPPSEVKPAIEKAFKACKKYVISYDWYDKTKIGATTGNPAYCFNHNYEELYYAAGARKVTVCEFKHPLFIISKMGIPKISPLFGAISAIICAHK